MSPSCDLDLDGRKSVFSNDTPVHDDASLFEVWSQKIQQFIKYCPKKYSFRVWTSAVTLTLNTAIQSFFKDALPYDDLLSKYVWLQKDPQFRK